MNTFFHRLSSLFLPVISISFAISGCVMNNPENTPAPVIELNRELERDYRQLEREHKEFLEENIDS